MTGYEKELLALAIEHAPYHRVIVWRDDEGWWRAECAIDAPVSGGTYLSDALTALLRDLGVEVPERPNARGIEQALAQVKPGAPPGVWLRDLYAREPLTVLALLEGGEA